MKTQNVIVKAFFGVMLITAISSCTETVTKDEHELSMANLQNSEIIKRDSLERVYISTLDEIDRNLDEVREKQGIMLLGANSKGEIVPKKRDQILGNIASINSLLEQNKKKIAALESSLSKYKSGKKELINSIVQAKEKVLEQERQIEEFKTMLAVKDFKIEELNSKVSDQNQKIEELADQTKQQEVKINTTYFAYGTYKELKEKNIVKKEGGVLGIRTTKVVNEDLNKSDFVELDKTMTTSIPVIGKNPKLITEHPASSYEFTAKSDEIAVLNIKDPESFWKVSKYLIVEVQ